MTVADLEDRMSNREFVYWSRFYAREGQRREVGL